MIKDSAKTIVCYGDSNTWGRIPGGERYPRSIRWPSVLQNLLGDDYEVISEGLSGRTFVVEDPTLPRRTGITHLEVILETHKPIDLVIVMLGTNDVKDIYNLSAEDITNHLEITLKTIKKERISKILVVCPPQIIEGSDNKIDERFLRGPEIFTKLPNLFSKVTEKYGFNFLNAEDYIKSSRVDGFHFDPQMHKKLAEVLSKEISKIV